MFIVPMSGITPINNVETVGNKSVDNKGEVQPFKEIFSKLIENVEETHAVSAKDAIDVALGDVDDLHTIIINTQKATVALELLVTVKNQALSAYNDIIKMQI